MKARIHTFCRRNKTCNFLEMMCRVIKKPGMFTQVSCLLRNILCVKTDTTIMKYFIAYTQKKNLQPRQQHATTNHVSIFTSETIKIVQKTKKKIKIANVYTYEKFTYWLDKNWQRAFYQRFQCHLTGITCTFLICIEKNQV